jgi:Tfp pilus assembly major pilin PilA
MRKQGGVTLTGFIVVAIIISMALLTAFKLAPAYFEYYSIKKQFKAVANDPAASTGTRRQIEGAFALRQTIENITSIGPGDIQITKDGGSVVLSAEYSVKVPLVGNLSACMDFNPSSAK